jgi:ribose-phosphate pyrophosphokinase
VSQVDKVTTKKMALYSGRTHLALANEVAGYLGIELGEPNLVEFANGEVRPRFGERVTSAVTVVPSTTPSWSN